MIEIFGIPSQALFGQLLLGLINGSFYALLSLGLAVIFGLLNIINFTHGAQYMMGAFAAFFLLNYLGLNYWVALVLAPLIVAATGVVIERLFLRHLYHLDHLYGLLLTFGLALIIQGLFRNQFGSSGLPYPIPDSLRGGQNLGFMFLPNYRAWVVVCSLVVCFATWFVIERTRLGAYLRAATENPALVRAFGINVPRMITLTYAFGVGLAALAGVMAAPIYNVNPLMGADLKGNKLSNAPSMTLSAGADFTAFDNGTNRLSFHPEVSYASSQYFEVLNTPYLKQKGYALLSGHIDFEHGPFTASIWGKNLTDKFYFTSRLDSVSGFGFIYNHVGTPRTYGGSITYKF